MHSWAVLPDVRYGWELSYTRVSSACCAIVKSYESNASSQENDNYLVVVCSGDDGIAILH